MTNKPYIEFNDKIYEFEANRNLQRAYNKDLQTAYAKKIVEGAVTKKDYETYEELEKYVKENPNFTIDDLEKDEKLRNKFLGILDLMGQVETPEVNEKYCRLMLQNKYHLNNEELDDIINDLYDSYGVQTADAIMKAVCEKVFTTVEEQSYKKPLPTWMQEN